MFHYDLQHSGYTANVGPTDNSLRWSYTTGDSVYSSPSVSGDRVYVGSWDNKVYCLNADNGSLIWSYTTGNQVESSPAVAGDRVYVGSDDDKVYCLNADNGSLIWSYTTGNKVESSPVVSGGRVYVGSYDHKVYCLNADNGSLIWSYTTGDVVFSCPAVSGGKVYVGSYDHKVYCLNADNGSLIWSYTTGTVVNSSPAVENSRVYIGSWDDNVYCLNADNGSLIWSYTTGFMVESSPAVSNGKVYVGSADGKVYCLNADNGSMIWSYTTGAHVDSSPAVSNGRVYFGCYNYRFYCLNADNGSLIWSYTDASVFSSAAVSNGGVYVGSTSNSKVYCFGPPQVMGVSVSISPTDNSGSNGDLLTYTVTVNNTGNVDDTYDLTLGDNASPTWSPSVLPTSLSVAAFSSGNATLSVTIPMSAVVGTIDNIWVKATSKDNAAVFDNKSCTALVTVNWTGTATFRLENLYKVSLNKNLQINTGSKLVVKFSKYDSTFQAESVIDSITPPQSVVANENAPQPRASEGYSWGTVQIATLVLTTDDTGNVISTIASFTVHQSDLRNRNITILRAWGDHPEQQGAFKAEAMDILRQWSSAPA